MPRTLSLRNRRDFDRVMSSGARVRRGGLQVFVAPAEAETRIGLAVRVRPARAVMRNRVRRRLRAAFSRCDLAAPIEVVIAADERAASMDFQELVDVLCGSIAEATA